MQLTLRNMAPALMVLTLALAGCKTAPTKNAGDAAATPQTGQQQQQQQSPRPRLPWWSSMWPGPRPARA